MPGLRTPVYFSMGVFKKSFLKFILIDGLAALISVPVWIYIGMVFGRNIPVLEKHVKHMQEGIYITLGIIIILFVLFHFISKKLGLFIYKKQDKIAEKLNKR